MVSEKVSDRRASKLVSHRIKPSRVVLSAALVHRNHLHASEMRSNRKSISRCVHAVPNKFWHMWKSTATSHRFDHPLFFSPALSLSLSFSHALPVSLARPHARARACSSVRPPATSTTRKNTMAYPSRDWALQQSLPPTNRGTTWPNCLLKLQSRTPRVLCNISCGPSSSVWKRLQPQIPTGPVTNRFTHFPEARFLPSPEERDRGAAASQQI